jgi:hypothetical protein
MKDPSLLKGRVKSFDWFTAGGVARVRFEEMVMPAEIVISVVLEIDSTDCDVESFWQVELPPIEDYPGGQGVQEDD